MKVILLLTVLAAAAVSDPQGAQRSAKALTVVWPFTPFVLTVYSTRTTVATDIFSCTSVLTALCVGKKKRAFILQGHGRISPSIIDSVETTAAPKMDKVRQSRDLDWYEDHLELNHHPMELQWADYYLEPAIQPYYDNYPNYWSLSNQIQYPVPQEQNPAFRLGFGLFLSVSTVYSDVYTSSTKSTKTVLYPCSAPAGYTAC